MIIDTHAHLDLIKSDIAEIISRSKKANVMKIINIGVNFETSKKSIEIARNFDEVYAALGIHPTEVKQLNNDVLNEFMKLAKNKKKLAAIGEIGLDYYHMDVPKEEQIKAFKMQLNLAKELDLPIIVHCRDAYEDTLKIIDEEKPKKLVFHCYSGSLEYAKKLWDKGFYTSFTGIITYPKVQELIKVVSACPMDRFMVETDCPFLAPQAYRGKENEPAYVVEVVKKIAEVKGMSFEDIEKASTKNAEEFFRLGY